MEDDLDNLIADSLGGVQTALEGERKATATAAGGSPTADGAAADGGAAAAAGTGSSQEWAKEAVRELQQGPAEGGGDMAALGEDFFANLAKTFQDENFQKAMAEALKGADPAMADALKAADAPALPAAAAASSGDASKSTAALPPTPAATAAPLAPAAAAAGPAPAKASAASSSSAAAAPAAAGTPEAEEFLSKFMQSFDKAVGGDQNLEQSLMSSMLSKDLICEPLEQISEKLEPWLKSQKSLAQSERTRYETMLRMYKHILQVYKSSPDPLPDDAREQVQRLLTELHSLGQPPDEVMQQLAPKDAEDGGQSFEDFMKSMGLDNNLGSAEQDLLKKLSEDPEELTKVMKDMAEGIPEEACKQQ